MLCVYVHDISQNKLCLYTIARAKGEIYNIFLINNI